MVSAKPAKRFLRYLITAGPTREYLDAVRYFSNASSGLFGYALADAALARGHAVTLISGPVALRPPRDVKFISVVSANDMLRAVLGEARRADIVVMNAAVSDYRPERRYPGKLKRSDAEALTVRLVRTPDVLATLSARKRRPVLVGFALEVTRPVQHAREKLRTKSLDFLVLNTARTVGAEVAAVQLFDRWGARVRMGPAKKSDVARQLLSRIENTLRARNVLC